MQATATIVTMACCSPQNAFNMTPNSQEARTFLKKMKIFFATLIGMGQTHAKDLRVLDPNEMRCFCEQTVADRQRCE